MSSNRVHPSNHLIHYTQISTIHLCNTWSILFWWSLLLYYIFVNVKILSNQFSLYYVNRKYLQLLFAMEHELEFQLRYFRKLARFLVSGCNMVKIADTSATLKVSGQVFTIEKHFDPANSINWSYNTQYTRFLILDRCVI